MIKLNDVINERCLTKCNSKKRKEITTDDLCNVATSGIDGLAIRCVGEWAIEKTYHLIQYFGIFASGMKNKWEGKITYIEICCGPGRCVNRNNGIEFNGTSLAVIEHPASSFLNKAIFFDFNPKVVDALNTRIKQRKNMDSNAVAIIGDYYNPIDIVNNIINLVGEHGLFLVFLDPTDCSLPFDLVIEMKNRIKNIDFIINLASGTDFNRNIRNSLLNPSKYYKTVKKYSSFLNSEEIFKNEEAKQFAINGQDRELRNMFRQTYENNLRKLGYKYFDFTRIRHFYDLLFASSHQRGIEFWQRANKAKYDGQRRLF